MLTKKQIKKIYDFLEKKYNIPKGKRLKKSDSNQGQKIKRGHVSTIKDQIQSIKI